MKLKAPPGAGDPCIAGVTLAARDGIYEAEAEIGALLIECFGFVELVPSATEKAASAVTALPRLAPAAKPKLMHPAWRSAPVAKKP